MSTFLFAIVLLTGLSWIAALAMIIFFFSTFNDIDKKDSMVAARLVIGFIFWPSFILYGAYVLIKHAIGKEQG